MVALDPVCHMEVDESTAQHVLDYQGKRYYFCRDGCKQHFRTSPQKYLAANYDPAKADFDMEADTQFTCPMHPEILKDEPGTCPLCGMALEPLMPVAGAPEDDGELKDMSRRFAVSLLFTIPVLLLSMFMQSNLLQLALTSPVVLWCGAPIFQRALASLKNRSLNMFTLIAVGTGVAYAFSTYASIAGGLHVYFETSAVIICLVLLGQVLELKARSRAGSALRELLSLAPPAARKILESGEEIDVPSADIVVGDRLRVRPGEKIPTDGTLVDGSGAVNESMLTGEAFPIPKQAGDTVTGGTLNSDGSFVIRADRVGAQTVLSQIVRMVAEAQRSQAPIQRLADQVSAYFVPSVILISAVTFLGWWLLGHSLTAALVNSIAVLIIACPCALGLATPMSIIVATGRGAKAGILIKNATVLEVTEKVEVVALDKTGTLTRGQPEVLDVMPRGESSEEDVLSVAASLEVHSLHPIARSICRRAAELRVEISPAQDFESIAGKGLKGRLGDAEVAVGTWRFLTELGVELPNNVDPSPDVQVAKANKLLGSISISDQIKPDASHALDALRASGIEAILLTGDSKQNAAQVASALHFEDKDVFAEVLPAEKANVIDAVKASGKRIAMAGDGINDAIALAKADVGIAMGHGSDVAMESAGITLVKGDLTGILRAVKLSRATMSNIRQNLFFAFIYNILGVTIATGIFGWQLSPMLASAAMSLSSVCVITNALRLRSVKI